MLSDSRLIIMKPKEYDSSKYIEQITKLIENNGYQISIDNKLCFWSHHFPNFKVGLKTSTIRYKEDKIRLPFGKQLLIYDNKDHGNWEKAKGIVTIDSVVVCPLNAITQEEAVRACFRNVKAIYPAMLKYYENIEPDSIISIYKFSKVELMPEANRNGEIEMLRGILGLK